MKKFSLLLFVIGLVFAFPACSDDDDDDLLPTYTIDAVPNNPDFGTVTGAGNYSEGETVTLTAEPAEDHHFIQWMEADEVVHQEETYTFTATEDRSLIAVFADDETGAGFFSMNVSGDVEWEFEGIAAFGEGVDEDTNQELFILMLVTGDGSVNLTFAKGGDQPGTGTIDIIDIDWEDLDDDMILPENAFLGLLQVTLGAEMYFFFSDGGIMEINESTTETLAGSFNYASTGFLLTQPLEDIEINVEGSFSAIYGDVSPPDPKSVP